MARWLALALLTVGRSSGLPAPPRLLITSGDGAEGFSMAVDLASLRDPTSLIACVDNSESRRSKALAALGVDVREQGSGLQLCFAGVTYALLLPPLTAHREARGAQLINASVAARDGAHDSSVRLSGVFLLSVLGAEGDGAPASLRVYAALERLLSDQWGDAPGKVVLRTSFYQQNLLLWAQDARHERALRLPLSDTACFAPLSASDVAAVVAQLSISEEVPESVSFRDAGVKVLTPGALPTLELSGPQWLSGSSTAALATAGTGSELAWETINAETAAGVLRAAGLDASEGELLLDMMAVQSVEPGAGRSCDDLSPLPDAPRLLGRPASPLALFFISHAPDFAPADPAAHEPAAHSESHSESHPHEHVHAAGWHGRVIHGYEAVPWQHAVVVGTSLVPLAGVYYAYTWAKAHPGSILYASFFPSVFTGRDMQANWNVM